MHLVYQWLDDDGEEEHPKRVALLSALEGANKMQSSDETGRTAIDHMYIARDARSVSNGHVQYLLSFDLVEGIASIYEEGRSTGIPSVLGQSFAEGVDAYFRACRDAVRNLVRCK